MLEVWGLHPQHHLWAELWWGIIAVKLPWSWRLFCTLRTNFHKTWQQMFYFDGQIWEQINICARTYVWQLPGWLLGPSVCVWVDSVCWCVELLSQLSSVRSRALAGPHSLSSHFSQLEMQLASSRYSQHSIFINVVLWFRIYWILAPVGKSAVFGKFTSGGIFSRFQHTKGHIDYLES